MSAPKGWELVRVEDITIDRRGSIFDEEDDLTALARAMEEQRREEENEQELNRQQVRRSRPGFGFGHPSQRSFSPNPAPSRPFLSMVPRPEEDHGGSAGANPQAQG